LEDLLDVSRGRAVTTATYGSEGNLAPSTPAAKASFERLAHDVGNRNPLAAGFTIQGGGQVIRKTDCCALHTCILASG
jgi:hypothetical protein